MTNAKPLSTVLDDFEASVSEGGSTVGDILDNAGTRSFTMAILVTALVLITPVSGVPTVPTVGGAIIFLAAAQRFFGRDHLWLPDIVLRRTLSSDRIRSAVHWLRPASRFIDKHTGRRLKVLCGPVADRIALATIMVVVLPWPVLELLPFVTSVGAFVVACLAFGLLVNDGVFVLIGYAILAALAIFIGSAL